MRTSVSLLLIFLLSSLTALASGQKPPREEEVTLETASGNIFGTIASPKKADKHVIALIIAGSGPTDRNGNNQFMSNNSLKFLAYGLAANGIPSLRYDKRGVAFSSAAVTSEDKLSFSTYVDDAREWIAFLRKKGYGKIIVVGHSEGSLIGLCIAGGADGFVSVAGTAHPADEILKKQLAQMGEATVKVSYPIIDSLKAGQTVNNVPKNLQSIFRPSVQPYMISWFRYDPSELMAQVKVPVLILQGTKDLQVEVSEATALHEANPASKLVIIENMNHVLKIIDPADPSANMSAYGNKSLPVSEELVREVSAFILNKN